ncbi:MAG TPA: carboxymuconolactone decarboxylase family protein [Stellaceae bacterium]|jgi:AhpD family alkylhydroperoxidase
MHQHWPELAAGLGPALKELRTGAAGVMQGFGAVARAAFEGTVLDAKTKELIALAIAVAIRRDACIAFHAEAAVKRGASRDEVMETMGMAIYMGAGPSVMYAVRLRRTINGLAVLHGRLRAPPSRAASGFRRKRQRPLRPEF